MDAALTLWHHEDRLLQCIAAIDEAASTGQEPPPEALALLETYATGAMQQRDQCARLLHELERHIEAAEAEIAYLRARRDRMQLSLDKIKGTILAVMQRQEARVLEGEVYTFRRRTNPAAVEILDPEVLPEDVLTVKTVKTPNKLAIKDRLVQGEDVPGARLVQAERLEVK